MTQFTTDSIFDALKSLLGVVDNEERRKQIEDYVEAARMPLEQSVSDLLARFTDAVNTEVAAHYQVTLNYRPGALDLDVRSTEPSEAAAEVWSLAEGEVEKITLRIPAELKDLATEAAGKAGLSVNAWFVRVLARALRSADGPEPPRHDRHHHDERHGQVGRRLSGWVGADSE